MKKAVPFAIGLAVLALLVVLMVGSGRAGMPKRFDKRITLRPKDKIPYGANVAYELLPSLFRYAKLKTEKSAPPYWDSVDVNGRNQAVILMADYFEPSREQLEAMADFVERGNYVFIISQAAAYDACTFFNLTSFNADYSSSESTGASDSLWVRLEKPSFTDNHFYVYPGFRYNGILTVNDSTQAAVLGRNENSLINFVRFDKGGGSFFLHSAPLAFSNYFILHKNNAAYYNAVFSAMPKDLRTVVWNEYYLQKPASNKEPAWLGALLSYPPFRFAFFIGLATLLLYLLLAMRRRQRMIPPHPKPVNDSLDFVKTLGRLYYDKRDHQNLAQKMATYFLDGVRQRYQLPTHTLDAAFVRALHDKSGYPEEGIEKIVRVINYLPTVPFMPEPELISFHKDLDAFYQTTGNGRAANF